MNYLNSIRKFVDTAFFTNVEISPDGNKILYSFKTANEQHDKYIETVGLYDITDQLNVVIAKDNGSFKPKWAACGKIFSILKNNSLVLYEANSKKMIDEVKMSRKISDYVWGNHDEDLWVVTQAVNSGNGAQPIEVGQFNTPSYISRVELTTGRITDVIFEEYGAISNIISNRDKLYYALKDNDVYDFAGTVKEVDLENQKTRRVDTDIDITVINFIGFHQKGALIFAGYDRYPSNSCLEKKIYSINLDHGKVDLYLAPKKERGTCLEAEAAQNQIIIKENCGTKTVLYSNNDKLLQDVSVEKCITNISVGENGLIAFVAQDFNEHPELCYCSLSQLHDASKYKKVDLFHNPALALKTSIVNWKGPDGKDVEGILIPPKEENSQDNKPLIVITTGRSNSFTRAYLGGSDLLGGNDKFPYPVTQFSELGYYTLLANCRSVGYHEFEKITNVDESSLDGYCLNVMAGIQSVLNEYRFIDEDRIAVLGWSLGGYVAARIACRPDSNIKVCVIGNAVTNLVSMFSCSNCFEFLAFMREGFWKSDEHLITYLDSSPIKYAGNMKAATLIQHGAEDPAIPVEQGREFYYSLRFAGKKVKMTEFPNAGHVFDNPADLYYAGRDVVNWLRENL